MNKYSYQHTHKIQNLSKYRCTSKNVQARQFLILQTCLQDNEFTTYCTLYLFQHFVSSRISFTVTNQEMFIKFRYHTV